MTEESDEADRIEQIARRLAQGTTETPDMGRRNRSRRISHRCEPGEKGDIPMSALGHKQTFGDTPSNVRYWG